MRVRVNHDIGDLANDLADIAKDSPKEMVKVVREGLKVGNSLAVDFAKKSSGKHGKHYPKSFSTEMHGIRGGFGVYAISGEYGPDASKRQGNMSFERGSRNQPAHLDLNRSADIIGPAFLGEVDRMVARLFW